MTSNSDGIETHINGDVEKLVQIGTVNGNVLILSESAVKEALPRLRQLPVSQDVTDYISVIVKSNRFGRKLQIQVPYDITVGAFIDLVVNVLQLPWSKRLDKLLISFDFIYSVIFGREELPLNQSLRNAGIHNGDEVQLLIRVIWTDEIDKEEQEEMKDVIYLLTDELLQRRENARKARGTLTQSKIKALADSCFAFVDKIGI